MTIRTPSGTTRTITPGRPWSDGAWYWRGDESPETLARHGYIVQPDPVPVPPTLSAADAAALSARMAAL